MIVEVSLRGEQELEKRTYEVTPTIVSLTLASPRVFFPHDSDLEIRELDW